MIPATARDRNKDCGSVREKALESVRVLSPLKQSHDSYRRSLEDLEAKGELGGKEEGESEELGGVG